MPSKKPAKRAAPRKGAGSRASGKSNGSQPNVARNEICGVIIVCLGLLSTYFVLSADATGFAGAVRAILMGLAGKLCYLLPVIICWSGILVAFSSRGKEANPGRIALIAALFMILFGFVQLYFVEDLLKGMREHTYMSFLTASARAQTGAGLLGAITAWPLYHTLSLRVWGSSILYIALAVVDLILMRKISLSSIREKAETRLADYQKRIEVRREERMERRDAREARREAERFAREQLVIPKATDGAQRKARPAAAAQDAFNQTREDAQPAEKQPKVEKIADLQKSALDLPNTAEAGVDEEPEIYRSLRARKGGKKRQPEPETLPPFDPGALLFRSDFEDGNPEEADIGVDMRSEEPEQIPTSDGIIDLETEVSIDEEDDVIIPGNPLVEEYAPKRQPAKPLPSFGEENTIHLSPAKPTEVEETEGTEAGNTEVGNTEAGNIEAGNTEAGNIKAGHIEAPPFGARAVDDAKPLAHPSAKPEPGEPKAPFEPASAPVMAFEPPPYNYPPVDLLEMAKPSKIRNMEQLDAEKGKKLTDILLSFGITTKLIGVSHGPTVTRFELAPASGIKVSRITSLVDDIALGLAAKSIRMEAPIPGKSAIGVEVPNDEVETVPLREVLESAEAQKHPSRLAAAMGRDNAGHNIVCDLAKMPHILIAGATGSGKSVCINCIICSILYRATPEEVRLILVDPKMVELSVYNGIPHLLIPVVTDPKKAAGALEWAVNEMTQRYKKFAEVGAKDIKGYNLRRPEEEPAMPQIVIIIDELADLMMVAPGDVEDAICRIAQLARAAGIHLVVATQRPSVNVITGVIKANIPSRVAFTVASQVDSRTILDVGGAEKLLMRGDMLYAPSGTNKPTRVQGCWVSENEVQAIVDYIHARHDAEYDDGLKEHLEKADMADEEKEEADDRYDDLLPQAIEFVVDAGQASISMLQRKMRIGYARAGRLIDEMAKRGYIGEADGAKPREVLMTREQYRAQFKD